MTRLLYAFVKGAALIHESILHLNDRAGLFLTDKQLHFLIMGLTGMGILMVIYPLFLILSRHHVLTIAWIYVFTVMVVLCFAIEIGQGITGTGNMEFADIMYGLLGFLVMFFGFCVVRKIYHGIRRLLTGKKGAGR